MLYAGNQYEEAVNRARRAIERKPDCDGAYYLLGRAMFASGRYQELDMAEAAVAASGDDYNVFVPIENALDAMGKSKPLLKLR